MGGSGVTAINRSEDKKSKPLKNDDLTESKNSNILSGSTQASQISISESQIPEISLEMDE